MQVKSGQYLWLRFARVQGWIVFGKLCQIRFEVFSKPRRRWFSGDARADYFSYLFPSTKESMILQNSLWPHQECNYYERLADCPYLITSSAHKYAHGIHKSVPISNDLARQSVLYASDSMQASNSKVASGIDLSPVKSVQQHKEKKNLKRNFSGSVFTFEFSPTVDHSSTMQPS